MVRRSRHGVSALTRLDCFAVHERWVDGQVSGDAGPVMQPLNTCTALVTTCHHCESPRSAFHLENLGKGRSGLSLMYEAQHVMHDLKQLGLLAGRIISCCA